MGNIFSDAQRAKAWPFEYRGTMVVSNLAGGVPTDENVAKGWIKSKLVGSTDEQIQEMVAKTMLERGVSAEEAADIVNEFKNLNGFKRDENGLYIEGRQLKAAVKEAVSIAVAAGKIEQRGWGATNKWIMGFIAEHVMVKEERLYLGKTKADRINQRFVSTHNGTGISYEEVVDEATITFTIISDVEFTDDHYSMIFLTGEYQGLGASRSQGFGRYRMTDWEQLRGGNAKPKKLGAIRPRASKENDAEVEA